jgi:succinate dehydrogenase / fumarate reductase flavoprotein subunit
MSESARGEGGRVWVPRQERDARAPGSIPEKERWYFLEEKYPAYGNLVPRDIATREIFQVCLEGKGIAGENQVYLDLTHIDAATLDRKLGAILEIYEMFVGDDPRHVPMRIFPGVHYSMGGLWVDFQQRTNIPGLLAAGECDYSVHGANRLGANSLVSCVYGGFVAAPAAIEFAKTVERNGVDGSNIWEMEAKRQQEINNQIIKQSGGENQYVIHEEMGKMMTDNVTVVRYNDRLQQTDNKLQELIERTKRMSINDSNMWATHSLPHARQLKNMLELARVITLGALNRDESRGAHYKPDFPNRDDERFLKTTIAEFTGEGPVLSYEAVDVSLVKPRKRDYSKGKDNKQSTAPKEVAVQAAASGLPMKDGAAQMQEQGWDQNKPNTSNPAVWAQNKEEVGRSVFGETQSSQAQGKETKDAGGKTLDKY